MKRGPERLSENFGSDPFEELNETEFFGKRQLSKTKRGISYCFLCILGEHQKKKILVHQGTIIKKINV